ncbi:CDON protein, partial [Eubucco bourcierii]|nr:CDON protein [Eubucco bourcierii]
DLTPRFTSEPSSTIQRPGGSVRLRCAAEPPAARLSWLLDGEPLESRAGEVEIQAGSLTIASLSRATTGHYQCVAAGSAGAVRSRPALVSMASLGEFEPWGQPSALAAEEGGTALLGCKLPESHPEAQVRFQVQGRWLEQSTDNYLILPSGNLQILNVSLEDKGSYRCAAFNPLTGDLRVEPSGRKLGVTRESCGGQEPGARLWAVVPRGRPRGKGQQVGGRRLPVKRRRKLFGVRVLEAWSRLPREVVETRLDEALSTPGWWEVSLRAAASGSASPTALSFSLEPPSISKGLQDEEVAAGGSVQFWCEVHGSPAPSLVWLHNAAALRPSPRHLVAGSRLRIRGVAREDAGLYQCVAHNGLGFVQATARLRVQPGR